VARATPFLAPLLDQPGSCRLRDSRSGVILADRIELAADSSSRRRGLLGRDRLDTGHALVIVPCGAVHTFFMRFPIDVLFVRRDGRVVKCAHDVRPWRLAGTFTAQLVIELPAGILRQSNTGPGDHLVFERIPASNAGA
jgi:hypothetical protein